MFHSCLFAVVYASLRFLGCWGGGPIKMKVVNDIHIGTLACRLNDIRLSFTIISMSVHGYKVRLGTTLKLCFFKF